MGETRERAQRSYTGRGRCEDRELARDAPVELWWLRTSATPEACVLQVLSDAERQRAAAFAHERARYQFAAGRALIRKVLGELLRVEPTEVDIAVDPRGKPFLARTDVQVDFSLSHAEDVVVLAVRKDGPVGVDVELDRRAIDFVSVGRAVFTQAEQRSIAKDPDPRQAFLRLWTAREAVLKAVGHGWVGARRLVPPCAPSGAYEIDGNCFWVHSFLLDGPARVAVAVDCTDYSLHLHGPFAEPWCTETSR